jgi:glycine/D-amino acid oxidase-like deaminating enzyme/nitrite reductase/ring-hydroxylating ferredoxin subunit
MAELDSNSYWLDSAPMPRFGLLDRDLTMDVVVIGAGITGLTAAYLLKRAGQNVAVIERRRAGGVDSMNTTAHLTCVTDADAATLIEHFGTDHARAVWDAGLAAILEIDDIRSREEVDCGFEWVRGYKFAALTANAEEEAPRLQREAQAIDELGFDARYLPSVPFFERPGVEVEGQARFHPRKYLSALAALVDGDGSHVFEHTESEEVSDHPLSVKASGHTISCGYVVIATHTPLMGKTNLAFASLFQTKLFLYSSYVLGGRVPKGTVPDALFWDTADPYHYLRIDARRDFDFVVFGGNDHKTGQANDTEARYRSLENTLKQVLPNVDITHRWSAQVVETQDGLPYIGETSSRQFAATGFAGNGMTFGTLAGMMARDAVLGRPNPWAGLFDTGRTKVKGGLWDYVKENIDYPYYLIRDRFVGPEARNLRQVGRGTGRIVEFKGKKAAAYRSPAGRLTLLSPVCTHMGCHVDWNEAESTWDCPCHGSRFKPTGAVLSGPAEAPLGKLPESPFD